MSKIKKWKLLACLLVIGIVTVMIYRCSNPSIKWQEEVRMEDGETLIVDRTAKGEMNKGELSGPWGWVITEMSFKVQQMPANWVAPPVWHSNEDALNPLLLDYQPEEYTWSLIAALNNYNCTTWKRLGGPSLPYVEYQSKQGGPWQVIPLEERLIGRKINMLISPSYKGESKLVTSEEINRRNPNPDKTSRIIVSDWNGCSSGGKTTRWKEKVRMADGEILFLHRTAEDGELGSYYYGRFPPEKLEVLKLPETWARPPIWRKEYVPILVDYQPQEYTWSIVATHLDCKGWELLGRPSLPYIEYQSQNGGPWEIIPLEERLIGRKTNLFPGMRSGGGPEFVTPEETDRHLQSADTRYQRVISVWESNSCSSNVRGE